MLSSREFPVLQWLRNCLPMMGTRIQPVVRELRSHMRRSNYWAPTLQQWQQKILPATTKTWCSPVNNLFKKMLFKVGRRVAFFLTLPWLLEHAAVPATQQQLAAVCWPVLCQRRSQSRKYTSKALQDSFRTETYTRNVWAKPGNGRKVFDMVRCNLYDDSY